MRWALTWMLVANELEKLMLFAGDKRQITLAMSRPWCSRPNSVRLYELTDAISREGSHPGAFRAGRTTGDQRRRGCRYWPSLHAGQDVSPDAGDPGEECSRLARHLAGLWQGFRVPPFAAEDIIRQARRYKSRKELTQSLRMIARADLAIRSNPPSKRMVLEKLVLELASEAKPALSMQEELLV